MENFKILAIRTGFETKQKKEIDSSLRKVLKPNMLYKFYQDYKFLDDENNEVSNDKEIKKIEYNVSHLERLYDTNDIRISISAIVGKNGSGKSTIIELFFLSIYLLSLHEKLLETNFYSLDAWEKDLNTNEEKLKTEITKITEIRQNIKKHLDEIENIFKNNEKEPDKLDYYIEISHLDKVLKKYRRDTFYIEDKTKYKTEKENIKNVRKNILKLLGKTKVEIFYEIDSVVYSLQIGEKRISNDLSKSEDSTSSNTKCDKFIKLSILPSNHSESLNEKASIRDLNIGKVCEDPLNLSKHFFYSIAISYSHYGLNAKKEGYWLNDLFHKNDSYQTPLVINPMRTDGNIDINKENDLANQRLLSNLLQEVSPKDKLTLRHFTPKKKTTKLLLKLNTKKIEEKTIENSNECFLKLYNVYFGKDFNYGVYPNEPTFETLILYVQAKLAKICNVYNQYQKFLKGDNFVLINEFSSKIVKDQSHVTFKLKQALNLIEHKHIDISTPHKEFEVDIEKLSKKIQEIKAKGRQVIEYLPPSIFDVRIQLEDKSFFDEMSSGEKQKIHSISTIIYHLINLNSVFKNDENDKNFYKYKYINILFDEVEQYFHPDLQRTFINDLLGYIGKINRDLVDEIKGMNMIFATHSPFILSDIPSSNILKLDDGNPKNDDMKTFASNIYELLADSFFLDEGFIGEKAKVILEDLVKFLTSKNDKFESNYQWNEEKVKELISVVGDDIIKMRLEDLYSEKFDKNFEEENLVDRRNRLKEELEEIEKQLLNDKNRKNQPD